MIRLGYLTVNEPYDVDDKNLQKLTHVNLAFATVRDLKGNVEFKIDDIEKLKGYIRDNPLQKICLSIGGWGAGNFSEAASTSKHRNNFIQSVLEILRDYNLDGVDLDWEYPTNGGAGISSSCNDRENFTILMTELRAALDTLKAENGKEYILSFAAGAGEDLVSCIDHAKLKKICDFVNIMTYDMGGSFNKTGHHASLYQSKLCEQKGGSFYVDLYHKAGYDYNQMVIGAAFYGRGCTGTTGINNPIKGQEGLYFDYDYVMNLVANDKMDYFTDDEAKASYAFDGDTFITLENEDSIRAKIDYVFEKNLAGIMFWEYATDKSGILLSILSNYRNEE